MNFHCKLTLNHIGTGTIFRLGEQKLLKTNQDNDIQSKPICNTFFFEKSILANFREYCVKSRPLTLQSVGLRLLLTVGYRKKTGEAGCTTVVAPQ